MGVTRRDALKTVGAGLIAGALGSWDRLSAQEVDRVRPNILWISCEDISPHLGCYGDPSARTPTLDQLAREGVRYTRAFTVAGVCAPSRSGIITAMYPSSLGSQFMRCQVKLPDHVKCFTEYLRPAGYYCSNNSKTDYNFKHPPSAWDESSNQAHWRKRAQGQPFFSVFNSTVTHESQYRPRGDEYAKKIARLKPEDRQDPARLSLPPYYPDTPEARQDWAQYYELITVMDYRAGDVLRQLEEDGLADDTIVFYWSDHGVGLPRAKRWLYDSGTHVPLIVRIPEKLRVAGQAEPESVDDRLICLIDLGPTVLNLAGVPVPEHMQGQPFLGPSLPPERRYIFGVRDRIDEREDMVRTARDRRFRYVRNLKPHFPYFTHVSYAESTPTMKDLRRLHAAGKLSPAAEQFMAGHRPTEELYDTESDPHEVHNLAGLPAHEGRLERLREALLDWMAETKDTGVLPEAELADREKQYGSRYAILRQPQSEDLVQRAVAVIELGDRGPEAALALIEKLADPEPVIRYWAATALGNVAKGNAAAIESLTRALEDDAASVRIAAARGLCSMGRDREALPVLIAELKNANEYVRLAAVTVLDDLGERARPALDAIEALKDDKNGYVKRVVEHALSVLQGAG
jgi:arylsulfatase A-like enzyme